MASSSSHRRGRLFGIKRKNLGEISRDFTQRHPLSQLWVWPEKITHCNWEQHDFFLHVSLARVNVAVLLATRSEYNNHTVVSIAVVEFITGNPIWARFLFWRIVLNCKPHVVVYYDILWLFSLCSSYCITFFWVRRRAFNDCRSAPSQSYGILYAIVTACQWY